MAGMRPQRVEIEPGTVMNFWVPAKTTKGSSTLRPKDRIQFQPKKAVVLLHGFAANGILTWQFQVLSLANKYAVYVPDFLFFGDSITDSDDRSPSFQAGCVAKGLSQLGVEKCTLVGLSYGGMVGFKMAQLYPNLVESMVITCSVMALTESVSSESLRWIGFENWSDCLLPETVEGVKAMFDVGTYKLPNVPDWIYKQCLEVKILIINISVIVIKLLSVNWSNSLIDNCIKSFSINSCIKLKVSSLVGSVKSLLPADKIETFSFRSKQKG